MLYACRRCIVASQPDAEQTVMEVVADAAGQMSARTRCSVAPAVPEPVHIAAALAPHGGAESRARAGLVAGAGAGRGPVGRRGRAAVALDGGDGHARALRHAGDGLARVRVAAGDRRERAEHVLLDDGRERARVRRGPVE
jgi:hypothetical protein